MSRVGWVEIKMMGAAQEAVAPSVLIAHALWETPYDDLASVTAVVFRAWSDTVATPVVQPQGMIDE